ncbi:hypothetical protein [Mariniblastus fucicola]|nr:hypothetical protein [Mariniblastus fucicola]
MCDSHEFFDASLERLAEELKTEIVVAKQLRGLHPLVERRREEFGIGSSDFSKWSSRFRDLPGLNISVGKPLQRRSLLIMDAVVKTAESLGFEFGTAKDAWRKGLYANGFGFSVQFKLRESAKRKLRPPTEDEKRDMKKYSWMRGPKYEMISTGKLLLELDGPLGTACYSVKDGQKVKVEDNINRLFMFLIIEIDRIRKIWAARESEKREAERRRLQLAEEKAAREMIEEKERALFAEAMQWQQCKTLRLYIEAVQNDDEFPFSPDAKEWVAWALSVANKYDPTKCEPGGHISNATHADCSQTKS